MSLAASAALTLAAALAVSGAASASTSSSPKLTVGSVHHKVHVMPTVAKMGAARASKAIGAAGVYGYTYGNPPLAYQTRAPVQVTAKEYVVWWNPGHLQSGAASNYGGSTTYQSLVPQFIKDLPGSGLYANNTQYYQVTSRGVKNYIKNTVAYGAAYTDTTPFPAGHCTNTVTGTNCITDADIIATVNRAKAAHSIPSGTGTMVSVFTPQGEGSCFDSSCGGGSYTDYCAYHGYTGTVTYANMPYADPNYCSDPSNGQTFPNNAAHPEADANINVFSHELTETVTDPTLSAWYDNSGYEIGDECAWQFGTENWPSGGNLQMNGHPYDTQPEASVHSAGCVYAGP